MINSITGMSTSKTSWLIGRKRPGAVPPSHHAVRSPANPIPPCLSIVHALCTVWLVGSNNTDVYGLRIRGIPTRFLDSLPGPHLSQEAHLPQKGQIVTVRGALDLRSRVRTAWRESHAGGSRDASPGSLFAEDPELMKKPSFHGAT